VQILSTKLIAPLLRSNLVVRPQLLRKLNQGQECGFVLVSAPAGYGKTTLLSSWMSQIECPVAWYSLSLDDDDPLRFLRYLAAALGMIEPLLEETLSSQLPLTALPEVDALLTPLINQIVKRNNSFWLVLDDFHSVQNQYVHRVIQFLLENRPAALHIAIATRSDLPVPMSRLRARSAVVELRQGDLRFNALESTEFLTHTMGLTISAEDSARVTVRTEGWVAGLQMAALSMQNTENIPSFVSDLSGSHQFIFDYLLDEVLGKQTLEVQHFLLSTSIVDQFSAPLCEALLNEDGGTIPRQTSARILAELERANLFILPLDPQRQWYRYHPLFSDLLRSYLLQSKPELWPVYHMRASAWFEKQGWFAEAIQHAVAARAWELVVRLISSNVFALLEQNELSRLAQLLERDTRENSLVARPWLWIGRGWLAAYIGQANQALHAVSQVESELEGMDGEVESQTLRGHCAAIRAFTAWMIGDTVRAEKAAQEALNCLPADALLIRCQSATMLALSSATLSERAKHLETALAYASQLPISHVTIFTRSCRAFTFYLMGLLYEAQAACLETIHLAQSSSLHQPLPNLSNVYGTLSGVLFEWNNLEGALEYAKKAVDLARRWEQADALHFAYTNLANALFFTGDQNEAFNILQLAWEIAHRTSPWFENITIAQEATLLLSQGNIAMAVQYLRQHRIDIETAPIASMYPLIKQFIARIFLAQKQYSKVLSVVASLLDDLAKRQNGYYLVSAYACQALAYFELGQEEKALDSLHQALSLAAPDGYLRIFYMPDRALMPLLQKARAAGMMQHYVEKLLEFLQLEVNFQTVPSIPGLIEPLSGREIEVLALLALGRSDKEIAGTLVIATETVHKHLKNIYGKLDVHRRTEAIARARELGIL
jgi:LuxR family transcriptional regulator, maltose regulon positive regulatory protein